MPSPTSTMVPTPLTSAPSSSPLISLLMIDVISSDRIAMLSLSDRGQPCAQPLQAVAHARVVEHVADAHGNPADERFVDHLVQFDLLAGELGQPVSDLGALVRLHAHRGAHLGQHNAALPTEQLAEVRDHA